MTVDDLQTQNDQLRQQLTAARGRLPGPKGLAADFLTLDQCAELLGATAAETSELLKDCAVQPDQNGRDCVQRSDLDRVALALVEGRELPKRFL